VVLSGSKETTEEWMNTPRLGLAVSLILLCGCVHLPAQYSQTVTAQILSNGTGAVDSPPIPNIGQSQHSFIVVSKNAPAHTCVGAFQAQLIGSYNSPGTSLPTLGLPQSVTAAVAYSANNVMRSYQATGAYPALALHFISADTTNCLYDAYYSGTIGGSPAVAVANAYANLQQYITTGLATSGDNTLISGYSTGLFLAVYGMQLCNKTANQIAIFKNGAGAAAQYMSYPNLAAGQCVTFPTQQLPLWSATYYAGVAPNTAGAPLVLNLANATEVDLILWYRLE
jgi:hypothetical protein